MFRLFACVFVFVSCLGGATATEWPGFRGPDRDGAVPDARLFAGESGTLEVRWKHELGPGYSAIAVRDGRLVTMFGAGEDDVLAAFDVESGEELWRYRIGEAYKGHDGSHDGPISTPLIADDRVYGLGPRGHLFAVDFDTGKEIWATHVVEDHGATKPYYGFGTSPLMAEGVLVVGINAGEGKSIAGFDPDNGALKWSLGSGAFEYASPIVATLGGRQQVVAADLKTLYGFDAATGSVLWKYDHGGDERAMGGYTIVPVPAGEDRLFLMNKIDSSVMLSVKRDGDTYAVGELWSGNGIKQSYVVPVYHDGHLYGMNNRIVVCVDAATGETKWRSREPGDGFFTRVGDHLVIITKPGTLHVAEASPEGYKELARLGLFHEHSWSEVAFAEGHLFARSMANLARIDPSSAIPAGGAGEGSWVTGTTFGAFLEETRGAADKQQAIETFLSRQPSFPIIEPSGAVHFVYRGDAEDVGIVGDMIGFRREDPMIRLDGTDLFYYSTRLEPDAAVAYGFIPNYGEPVADPLNPRAAESVFGDVSWLAMPAWEAPDFLEEAEPARQGRLEAFNWESTVREGQKRSAEVYLPAGYDDHPERRYSVLYVHHGKDALEAGRMKNALDRLIGAAVEPVIAVFVIPNEEDPRADLRDMESYSEMVVEELVPAIDDKYRTVAEPMSRASVGSGRGANVALFAALSHPDVFARIGTQSATFDAVEIEPLLKTAAEQPMVIYMEWGTYHLRSPHEAWDLARESRKIWTMLREAGYRPAGGEVPEGYSRVFWNGHTDELLNALFPL